MDLGRLQGFLGLTDGANRCLFRNAGDEPVAFVVAAKELALFLALSDEEQQVAVVRLHVEDGDFNFDAGLPGDFKELAVAVSLHVQRNDAYGAVLAGQTISDLQPSAHASKLDVEEVRVHEGEDTATMG